jgi:hypothetical protein
MRACIAILLIAIAGVAVASKDRMASWQEFTIRASVHAQPLTVVARVSGSRLTSLSAESAGNRLEVPNSELADLPNPQLQGVQILYGTFRAQPRLPGTKANAEAARERPYYYVKLGFGEPKKFDYALYFHEVSFMFWDGKYRERSIRWVEGKGQWRYETKQPGQAPKPMGTESIIGHTTK